MSTKNKLAFLSVGLLASVSLILLLFIISGKINGRENGFIRIYPSHRLKFWSSFDLKFNSYYIAGGTKDHFYFGNTTAPSIILEIDKEMKNSREIKVFFKDSVRTLIGSMQSKVDSPYITFSDGVVPAIWEAQINQPIAQRLPFDSSYFTSCVPVTRSSFAIRISDKKIGKNILAKETSSLPHLRYFPDLLQKQLDGFFCTDGMLLFNKVLKRLVYIYYYRNQFICMDTSLQKIYTGKTIDTNSQAKIKVDSLFSGSTLVMSAPPLLVNKKSCTSDSNLFILSGLKANNETFSSFQDYSPIDVYSLQTGNYKFSIYIPDLNYQKIKSFGVFNDLLVLIQDHYARCYIIHS